MSSKFWERRNCLNFTKVTQKISAFTSNVTDPWPVYPWKAKENLASHGIFDVTRSE